MATTSGPNLLKIRQRLKLRREDLAHHSRLAYHTICRCEAENRWPLQFARRLAYQECLRELLRQSGATVEAIQAAGIPDLMPTLRAEIDRCDEAEAAAKDARTVAARDAALAPVKPSISAPVGPLPPAPPPPGPALSGSAKSGFIPGRGPGFFAH